MIIGVTGLFAAGKDTLAEFLEEMNFEHISFSDVLREELQKQDLPINRENLRVVGNELRTKEGPDVLAKKAIEKIRDGENYVFTSIRVPAEVDFLQKRDDFLLIDVTAPAQVRLLRIVERGRDEDDPKTVEELLEKENKENSNDPNAQNLKGVASMAQLAIENIGTKQELQQKAAKLIEDWLYTLQDKRPHWDDYFMNLAEHAKLRATCLSAKKGAIIVKDKMILSTGYNGSPKGVKHCIDGGCQRCTSRHLGKMKSGQYIEPCICCHAEENAIVQAAYNGTSTKGGVIYTSFTPCTNCAKLIINAGITDVYAKTIYPDDTSTKLFQEAGVKLHVLKD